MQKRYTFILSAVCVCFLFLQIHPVSATQMTIKHFNSYNHSQGRTLKNKLIDPNNFGPGGIVEDISFSVEDISEISTANITEADILLMGFSHSGQNIPSAAEANEIKNYVDQGGSLIVLADGHTIPREAANSIGSLFDAAYFSGWNKQGATDIINRNIAPEITDGPFGDVDTLTWGSNAATRIVDEGNSTRLDSFGMFSVITPTATSGSVVFIADSNLFYLNHPDYTGNWDALNLNILTYSAHSSRINNSNSPIPEPAAMLLFGSGLLCLSGICRKN